MIATAHNHFTFWRGMFWVAMSPLICAALIFLGIVMGAIGDFLEDKIARYRYDHPKKSGKIRRWFSVHSTSVGTTILVLIIVGIAFLIGSYTTWP